MAVSLGWRSHFPPALSWLKMENLETPAIAGKPSRTSLRETYSVAEAADYLGFSKSWLDRSRLRGGGPAYCKIGRAIRYRCPDLEAYLDAMRRNSTSGVV